MPLLHLYRKVQQDLFTEGSEERALNFCSVLEEIHLTEQVFSFSAIFCCQRYLSPLLVFQGLTPVVLLWLLSF